MIALRQACAALPPYERGDLVDGPLQVRAHRNEAALPPPPAVLEAVRGIGAETLRCYPADLQRRVARRLARRLGVTARGLALANGADEMLLGAARATLDAGDEALMARPAFGMYARAVAMMGAIPRRIPYRRRWQLDVDAFLEGAGDRTKLVYLGHPNNPTGEALPAAALERIARALPRTLVLVDEAYLALGAHSLIGYAGAPRNVIVAGSLSKVCALAGLRIGYLAGDPLVVGAIRKMLAPYALSAASLVAADAFLSDEAAMRSYEAALCEQVRRSLDALTAAALPFARAVWRGPASFALVDVGTAARPLTEALRRRGIAVRSFGDPDLSTCVRICALDDAGTVQLSDALRELLPQFAAGAGANA